MNTSQPTLDFVIELALQAGALLRHAYGSQHDVKHKGRIDLVTEMDGRCEEVIAGQILQRFPDHSIVGEESGERNGKSDSCWYIDPLDGTTNYAHGVPLFSVSIGYAYRGEMLLGVVYDPMRDEVFSAEKANGAFVNGQPIQVSAASDLEQCLLLTGFPYDVHSENYRWNLDNFVQFSMRSQGVRRLGSAALDFCYVASGRIDGYWEVGLKAWDLAAGALIAREAGATVTDLKGDINYMKPPYSHVTAAPKIHPQMLAILNR